MLVLVGSLTVSAITATVKDDGTSMHSWPTLLIFSIYALVQIVCLAMYDYRPKIYKIGFALVHAGILVMLVGFLAYNISGEYYTLNFTVGEGYDGFYTQNDDGEDEYYEFGFGVEIDKFTVEKYESGSDKFYHADLTFSDDETAERETAALEVNRTLRKNGWKIYLMDYGDGKNEFVKTFGHYKFDYEFYGDDWQSLSDKLDELEYPIERYYCYLKSAGGYVSEYEGEELTDGILSGLVRTPAYAHVLIHENKAYVYVYRQTVSLAFKKDPGEYAVVGGMCMTLVGTVMTCVIGRKKHDDEEGDGE